MKKPRVVRTKEELLRDLQKRSDFIEKMTFIKEKFYPALIEATTSIEDATQNLNIINSIIMEKFLGLMKEKKVGELNIYSNLSDKDPKYEQLKALLGLFDDMDVFSAKEYFEGVKMEIEQFKADYWKDKTLNELPAKWMSDL